MGLDHPEHILVNYLRFDQPKLFGSYWGNWPYKNHQLRMRPIRSLHILEIWGWWQKELTRDHGNVFLAVNDKIRQVFRFTWQSSYVLYCTLLRSCVILVIWKSKLHGKSTDYPFLHTYHPAMMHLLCVNDAKTNKGSSKDAYHFQEKQFPKHRNTT